MARLKSICRIICTVASVCLLASPAYALKKPKKSTKKPVVLQEPTVENYPVTTGDTLWAICERNVGSGSVWPKIWSYNPELTNPNWIYPGDLIRFLPSTEPLPSLHGSALSASNKIAAPVEVETKKAATKHPSVEVITLAPTRPRAKKPGRLVDLFVTEDEVEAFGTLSESVSDSILLAQGAILYFDLASKKTVMPGDRFLIYRTSLPVMHPKTHKRYGYMTEVTGLASVLDVDGKRARAELIEMWREVERGQKIIPYSDSLQTVLGQKDESAAKHAIVEAVKPVEGIVVSVGDSGGTVASDRQLIVIDRGQRDGLLRGTRLGIFKHGANLGNKNKGMLSRGEPTPLVQIGTIRVLDEHATAATCIVERTTHEIEPGDVVRTLEPKAQSSSLP